MQKAVDLSKKAIAKNPDNWLPHRTLAEIYDSRKLSDDAMREYKTAARLNPNDADALYALGKLQYRAKLFADAQKSFEGCVALRPDFTSAHFNRGMTLVQLGDKARAIDAFKSAIATKKDSPTPTTWSATSFGTRATRPAPWRHSSWPCSTRRTSRAICASWAPLTWRAATLPARRAPSPRRLRWIRTTPSPTTTWHP